MAAVATTSGRRAGARAVPADQAERVRQHGRVGGVLAQGLGAGAAHQAPAGDVLHAAEQRAERIGFHLHATSGLWYNGAYAGADARHRPGS